MIDHLLVHIGYHKTATTWLQQHVFTSDSSVFFPLSREDQGHSTLAVRFFRGDDGYLLPPFEDPCDAIRDAAQHLMQRVPPGRIPVVSHERLSGNPHSSGFDSKKIAHILHAIFPEAKIFVAIREQRAFLLSNYLQYLSIGGTKKLSHYLTCTYDGRRPSFSPHHVDYLPLITEYLQLFGKDNLLVLPYEMFRLNPRDFLSRLGHFVGGSLHDVEEYAGTILNQQKHHFSMYHLRVLGLLRHASSVNNHSAFSNSLTSRVSRALLNFFGSLTPRRADVWTKERLEDEIDSWAGERYSHSNAVLSGVLEYDLADYGYSVGSAAGGGRSD